MAKHQRRSAGRKARPRRDGNSRILTADYDRARKLAADGRPQQAGRLYQVLKEKVSDVPLRALIENDLAAIRAAEGDSDAALKGFKAALAIDERCLPARLNLRLLEVDRESEEEAKGGRRETAANEQPLTPTLSPDGEREDAAIAQLSTSQPSTRVAILSFIFNWPSTGGGIVHTVELAQFLGRAGYDVKHFYARHLPWGVGKVEGVPPFPSEAIEFDDTSWHIPVIQDRFRRAVDAFGPDYVIVTDSWNSKPLLAEAIGDYPYILRLQALECLCPLNNVRLIPVMETGTRTFCQNGPEGAAHKRFPSGDPDDLARKIEILLDDPALRDRMGLAGRRRFEEHYAWDMIIERHYRPLLKPRVASV